MQKKHLLNLKVNYAYNLKMTNTKKCNQKLTLYSPEIAIFTNLILFNSI